MLKMSDIFQLFIGERIFLGCDEEIERPRMTQSIGESLYDKAKFIKLEFKYELIDGKRVRIMSEEMSKILIESDDG